MRDCDAFVADSGYYVICVQAAALVRSL